MFQKNNLLNRNSCKRQLGHVSGLLLNERHICVQKKPDEGICGDADLGDPLVTENGQLVGIASWNNGCGHYAPDVFTRIYFYLDWIHRTIQYF